MKIPPQNPFKLKASSILRALVLFAWATLFIGFDLSGRLHYFLAPGFRPFILVSGLVLFLLAVVVLSNGGATCCHSNVICDHRSDVVSKTQIASAVFLLFLLLSTAFAVPKGFSAEAVLNRMGNSDFHRSIPPPGGSRSIGRGRARVAENVMTNGQRRELLTQDEVETQPYDAMFFDPQPLLTHDASGKIEADLLDLWAAAADPGMRRNFVDQTLIVTGQLLPPPDHKTNQQTNLPSFKLVRLMITCCAADAQPVSVSVFSDELPDAPDMAWIRIEGTLDLKIEEGEYVPYIRAKDVQLTQEPKEVFLFY